MRQKILSSLLVCGSLMFASTGASAAWPERDINITVMYGAGGNTDQLSRALASKLEEELGRTVIVHNRPGGQGTVGPDWVSRQKPDGYNLAIVTGSSIAMAPHTTNARYTPSDFTYIGAFAMPRFGVAVHHDASYGSMQELVDKAQKDEIFMASGAILNSLVLLELNSSDDTQFTVVPYKSGAEVTAALLGQHVDVIVSNPPDILPHVEAGQMRLLASGSPYRWNELPDVPTLTELGLGSGGVVSWVGLAGPKGLPADVLDILSAAMEKVANDPEFQERVAGLGADPVHKTGDEVDAYMHDRYKTWLAALQEAELLPAE